MQVAEPLRVGRKVRGRREPLDILRREQGVASLAGAANEQLALGERAETYRDAQSAQTAVPEELV